MTYAIEENFYCTHCGTKSYEESDCCGQAMLERSEAEGYGLSEFEPSGTNTLDLVDDWN